MIGIGINTTLRGINAAVVPLPVATAATGVGSSSFTANWNAYTEATYYLLDVSTSSTFNTFIYENQVTTSTSYVVIGLEPDTTYYYRVRAVVGTDSDAQAFFDRVTTAGGTLSETEQTAISTLVIQMKADGIWSKMKAIYPMVGASAAACAQNLKSNDFNGTFTATGWTFASTGVKSNGSSAFFDTNLNQSTHITNTSQHISYYSRTNGVDFPGEIGIATSNTFLLLRSGFYSNQCDANYVNTPQNLKGFYLGSRTSSNLRRGFYNGSQVHEVTDTPNATSSLNYYIGALNSNGVAGFFSPKECAFASIGDGLTNDNVSDFYTAVQTFNQTLNRNVGPQVVSDADAQAYINRVYNAGGTLTNTEANAVNQLTINMKAAGIWTKMKAVYPMVGSSAASCAQNLKSPSFTGVFTVGGTYSSDGYNGNSIAYMDTGYNANTEGSLNSAHLSCYVRTNLQGNGQIGCYDGSTSLYHIFARYNDNKAYLSINAPESDVSNTNSQGFWVGSRITSTVQKLYLNNSTIINATVTSVAKPNRNVFVGASNGPTVIYSPTQIAFGSIGDGLTDDEAGYLYTAVQFFQETLNREITP